MKKIFVFILLLGCVTSAQLRFGEAKGLFMGISVGPRFPIFQMSDDHNIGIGAELSLSYTDNEFIPVFFYTAIGYQHYPGKQSFYKKTNYSSFSSNVFIIKPGIRYYFKPIFEQVILLMPIVDIGAEYALFEKWHQFKLDSGRDDFVQDLSRFGFHVGAGFSMFLLDFITTYNYLPDHQFISVDIQINLPIFIKI
jgi:hypothetical protein